MELSSNRMNHRVLKVFLKSVFRVNAVLQKYLAKGKPFARIFAKPYQDEDRLRTRFDV
jgi:hypothetical protein